MKDTVAISVDITNSGYFSGEETVQLYVRCGGNHDPACERISGIPKDPSPKGRDEARHFPIDFRRVGFFHADLSYYAEAGEFVVYAGGSSDAEKSVRFWVEQGHFGILYVTLET